MGLSYKNIDMASV